SVSALLAGVVQRAPWRGGLPSPLAATDARAVEAALLELSRRAEVDGDPVAIEILDHAARGLARVGMQLANLLDLDAIVFGGPQWPAFAPACLRVAPELVNENFVARDDHRVEVRGTAVGGHVGAMVAAYLAMSVTMVDAPGHLYLG